MRHRPSPEPGAAASPARSALALIPLALAVMSAPGAASAQQPVETLGRCLADTCAKEVRGAVQSGGAAAIPAGFQVLGQLAMQELMTNPDVGAAMALLDRHIDRARVEGALQGR